MPAHLPTLDELYLPFFARPSTKRYIDQLSRFDNLAVFVGAGVSIDRTGLTWSALMAHLLAQKSIPLDAALRLVDALGGPMQAGSLAEQLYCPASIDEECRVEMANVLRSALYKHRDRLGGSISRAIAELWLESENAGRTMAILTTNYDSHLEEDIQVALSLWEKSVRPSDRLAGLRDRIKKESPITYLHGKIPKNERITDLPVISERDYLAKAPEVESALKQEFTHRNTVFLGSSLTDRPLLNALIDSQDSARSNGVRRVALVSRAGLQATKADDESVTTLRHFSTRLDHFGVEAVYFDHYCQVGQFLSEMRIASTLDPGSYPESEQRYGERLGRWWRAWYEQINTAQKFEQVQTDHHRRLKEKLSELKRDLGAHDEDLKVELWIRWNPTNQNRKFLLWASSYALYEGWKAALQIPIANDSKHACVQAFRSGRIAYGEADERKRWRTSIGLPLEPNGEVGLVVGSIVVVSMTRPGDSRLNEEHRRTQVPPLTALLDLGAELTRVHDESQPMVTNVG